MDLHVREIGAINHCCFFSVSPPSPLSPIKTSSLSLSPSVSLSLEATPTPNLHRIISPQDIVTQTRQTNQEKTGQEMTLTLTLTLTP